MISFIIWNVRTLYLECTMYRIVPTDVLINVSKNVSMNPDKRQEGISEKPQKNLQMCFEEWM